MDHPPIVYVRMMQNFMVIGGMKVQIGYMFYLKKSIMIIVILKLITPGEYIDKYPNIQVASPCRSSWGANGYNEVWLNPLNDYAHRHLHKAGDEMVELLIYSLMNKMN